MPEKVLLVVLETFSDFETELQAKEHVKQVMDVAATLVAQKCRVLLATPYGCSIADGQNIQPDSALKTGLMFPTDLSGMTETHFRHNDALYIFGRQEAKLIMVKDCLRQVLEFFMERERPVVVHGAEDGGVVCPNKKATTQWLPLDEMDRKGKLCEGGCPSHAVCKLIKKGA